MPTTLEAWTTAADIARHLTVSEVTLQGPRRRARLGPARPHPRRSRPDRCRPRTSDAYAKLLAALHATGSLANSDVQTATDLDVTGVRPLLHRLVAEGATKVEGQMRGTRYVLTRKPEMLQRTEMP